MASSLLHSYLEHISRTRSQSQAESFTATTAVTPLHQPGEWTHRRMSIGRDLLACCSCGDYTIFAGGSAPDVNQSETDEVDVWHHPTDVFTKAKLSQPRKKPEAVCAGGKIVIAGGEIAKPPAPPPSLSSSLSPRRHSVHPVGHRVGSRDYSDVVDVFDTATAAWSTSRLGQARQCVCPVVSTLQRFAVVASLREKIRSLLLKLLVFASTHGPWTTL